MPAKVTRAARRAPLLLLALLSVPATCFAADFGWARTILLVEELPAAEVRREVRRIAFGTAEARQHLLDGWSHDEAGFVWGIGERSALTFFWVEPRPLTLELTGWPFECGGQPQTVQVRLNGTPVSTLTLAAEAHRYRLHVAPELTMAGDNRLELEYARQCRPTDVIAGADDERQLAAAWHELVLEGALDGGEPTADGSALVLPPGARVDYFLDVAPGSCLAVDAVVAPSDAAVGRVEVRVEYADGQSAETLAVAPSRRPQRACLTGHGLARLSLQVAGPATTAVNLTAPRLELPAEPRRDEAALRRRRGANVIIYLIDALRVDHLGMYGYQRPTSPRIDRFAREATLFTAAAAPSSWTRPSVASLFTGTYPPVHAAQGRRDALGDALPTLAGLLAAVGYQTVGVTTNANVGPEVGLGRGFDVYRWLPESRARPEMHVLSDELNVEVLRCLDAFDPRRPFFLYLHASDPHGPYTPREPFRQRFGVGERLPQMNNPLEVEQLEAAYDAEIAFNDRSFGELLDRLRALDLFDDTLVVLLADHGEAFLDHGQWQHGTTLYSEELHVPLIVKLPASLAGRAPRTVDAPCSLVDVLPTLLDAVGLPVPATVQGQSLLGALQGSPAVQTPRTLYAFLDLDGVQRQAVSRGALKLVNSVSTPAGAAQLELFDRASDSGEKRSLAAERAIEAGFLRAQLRRAARWRQAEPPAAANLTKEQEDALRALGYLVR